MSALAPMRPTFLRSPPPAMPTTRVEKTSGAMTDLMRLRKISRRKKTLFPQSGPSHPRSPPTTRPIMIQVVSDRRYQGLRGCGTVSVVPVSSVVSGMFVHLGFGSGPGQGSGMIDHNPQSYILKCFPPLLTFTDRRQDPHNPGPPDAVGGAL